MIGAFPIASKEGGCIAVSLYIAMRLKQVIKRRKETILPYEVSDTTHVPDFDKGTPRCTRFQAVLTVEAAVIMPLLTYFFVTILFFFRVMQAETAVQKALDDTGRQLAVYFAEQDNKTAGIAAAKGLFVKEMSGYKGVCEYITGGRTGVSLFQSRFEGEEIHLQANYKIRLPLRVFWVCDFNMEQRADCRKWSGWKSTTGQETGDVWVYITQNGTVYHTTKTCTHLKLSIRSVSYKTVHTLRNENGGKYYGCELCVSENLNAGQVYITNQGDCYHSDLNCSGIRRTILMVRLSEVGNRRKCSRCGGGAE